MIKTKIRVTIQAFARKHGIKNAYQFQKALELAPSVAADLWKGEKLPRLESLERICEKWGCDISDLVRFVGARRPKSQNGTKRST